MLELDTIRNNWIPNASLLTALPDCVGCGDCCRHYVVQIGEKELVPEEYTEPQTPVLFEHGIFANRRMRHVPGTDVCAAFDIVEKKCRIHEHKPRVCKEFKRGSLICKCSIYMHRFELSFDGAKDAAKRDGIKPVQLPIETKENSGRAVRYVLDGKCFPWVCIECRSTAKSLEQLRHRKTCSFHPNSTKGKVSDEYFKSILSDLSFKAYSGYIKNTSFSSTMYGRTYDEGSVTSIMW